jgi:transcriptional regulator with XRE-family HTH domain
LPRTGLLLDAEERRSFTAWLTTRMERSGLSRRELGRRLGYDGDNELKAAQRYLTGAIPTRAVAHKLANVLQVPSVEMLVRSGHLDAVLPAMEYLAAQKKPWARKLLFDLIFTLFPPCGVDGRPLLSLQDGVLASQGALVEASEHAVRRPGPARGKVSDEQRFLAAFRSLDAFVSWWGAQHRTLRNPYLRRAHEALHDTRLPAYRRRAAAANYLHAWAGTLDHAETQIRLGAAVLTNRIPTTKKEATK